MKTRSPMPDNKRIMHGLTGLVILLFTVLLTACQRQPASEGFKINGTVKNGAGRTIVLSEMDTRDINPLDSVVIGQDGSFSLSHPMKDPGFYLVTFSNVKIILVVQRDEKIILKADLAEPQATYVISGSEDTRILRDFLNESGKNKARTDSLKEVLLQHEDHEDFYAVSLKADSAFQKISKDQAALETQFIDTHPRSLASLIVLNYSLGGGPVLDEGNFFSYYLKLENNLKAIYPENKHVLYHHRRVEEIQKRNEVMKEMGRSGKK